MKKAILIFSVLLSLLLHSETIQGNSHQAMVSEETEIFEKIIEDRISDGDKLEFRWIHQVLSNDWKKFFGLCACHYTIDVTRTSTTGGRRRRINSENKPDNNKFSAEEVIIFTTDETKVKIKSKDFHILLYAEFDDKENVVFKFINFPVEEPDFRYMKNVEFDDFVAAERKDFEHKLSNSKEIFTSYKNKINEEFTKLQNINAVVAEDRTGNPVCSFSLDPDTIVKRMERLKATLHMEILLINDRRELHRKLFEDYDENVFSEFLNKTHDEIDPIIEEAKKFIDVELVERKDEAMKAYWKERHEKERVKENKDIVSGIKAELNAEMRKANSKNSALMSDVMIYDIGMRKQDLVNLFKKNLENAQATVDFIEKCLNDIDVKNEMVDVEKTINEIVEEEPEGAVDLRPLNELKKIAEAEVGKVYRKTEEELHEEDRQAVLKKYKYFKVGTKIAIEYVINGKTQKVSGLYKIVGPGKIMVGTKIVTVDDLPYELRACLKTKKEYDEFTEKEIKKYPITFDYNKKKNDEIQKLTYKMLMKQFEDNLPRGYCFFDGEWFSSHDLANQFLLKNLMSNQ